MLPFLESGFIKLFCIIFLFVIRLHTFREVPHFRMMVCGGDGTVGWVLGVLETIRHKLACTEPAIGIVPLGTGTHRLCTRHMRKIIWY